jgi:hypothetical protein
MESESLAVNPAEQHAGFLRHEFKHDGHTYVYDFERITFVQAQLATEVMQFKRQTVERPAKSLRDMLLSGGGDYLTRVVAYILTEINASGNEVAFNIRSTYDRALAFVQSLPVSMETKIEECVTDFFSRRGKESLVSTVLLREQELDVQSLVETMLRAQAESGLTPAAASSMSSAHSSDSMSLMNSSGDSETE